MNYVSHFFRINYGIYKGSHTMNITTTPTPRRKIYLVYSKRINRTGSQHRSSIQFIYSHSTDTRITRFYKYRTNKCISFFFARKRRSASDYLKMHKKRLTGIFTQLIKKKYLFLVIMMLMVLPHLRS